MDSNSTHLNDEIVIDYQRYKIGTKGMVFRWGRESWVKSTMTISTFDKLRKRNEINN